MVKKEELEAILTSIEKRRLGVEEKRTLFQFETAFFIPLFTLLFLVTYFSKNYGVKTIFYFITIALIVADLIYSVLIYKELSEKQMKLEEMIHRKIDLDL
jgi:positive regulator of sigma E activity